MSKLLCCFVGADAREANELNKLIEKRIRIEQKNFSKEYKLLLLGTGESGKSTFVKQMRIIHGNGYSESDRKTFVATIRQNILISVRAILMLMENFDYTLPIAVQNGLQEEDIHQKDYIKFCAALDEFQPQILSDLKVSLEQLWNDKLFKTCLKIGGKTNVPDSTEYFLTPENMNRILCNDYIPSQDDVIRSRAATTGILEFFFEIKKVNFRIIDVGGQRSERRKWIHCFDNVTSIIFLASMSEYDQFLIEAPTVNRTRESLGLFTTILGYNSFFKTSIILFLNKSDLLEKKIQYSNIRDHLPEFEGNDNNFEDAKKFFSEQYNNCNKDKSRTIYTHFTCATDTDNIKIVFNAVKDTLLQHHLEEYSLV